MRGWIAAKPRASDLAVRGLVVLFTAGLTAVVLQESMKQGRLSVPPTFDDISYMEDAAQRVRSLYEHGAADMLRGLVDKPPHSPYATAAAMLAFLIFGVKAWAPYIVNAVVPLIFYAFVAYLGRGMRLWLLGCIMAAVSTIPMVVLAAHEFRPDFLSATLTCMGATLLVAEPSIGAPARRSMLTGALFGAAVLAKPTALPATAALLGLSWLLAALTHNLVVRGAGRRAAIRTGALLAAGFIAVAGPYLAADRGETMRYTWYHTMGPGAFVWPRHSRAESLRFYLDGQGGAFMLGPYLYGLLGVVVLGGACCALRGTKADRLRAGSVQAVLLAAYAICTLAPKHVFFGLPFQEMLLVSALLTVRRAVLGGEAPPLAPGAAAAALVALTVMSIGMFRFPYVWSPAGSDRSARSREMYDLLYDRISALLPSPTGTVLLTFTGEVNAPNLQFRALQDQRDTRYIAWELARTPEEYETWLGQVDLVVAVQSGTRWGIEGFPSGKILDQTIAYLDKHPRFARAAQMPVPGTERWFYFYLKR